MDMSTEEKPRVIHELFTRSITVYKDRAIKKGSYLSEHEVSNLQFVAENTTVPVPRVHRVNRDESGKMTSFEMDYIPGQTLEKAWPTMTHDQKTAVAEELHGYMMQIRNLKGTYIGGHNHGTAWIGKDLPKQGGPFATEKLFNEFIFSEIIDTVPEVLHYYAKNSFRDDHEIVFTHGDLAPRNIIVDDDFHVSAILDWESGGWYPAWWEYFMLYYVVYQVKKWEPYVSIILPPEFSTEFCALVYLYNLY